MEILPESGNLRILLSWTAPVAAAHQRSLRWYLYGGIFVVSCAAYGIIAGEWSFSIVMILLAGFYVLTRRAPEPVKTIAILEEGFIFENEFTEWRDCKDFWMLQGNGYLELHIMRNRRWSPEIVIQTGSEDPRIIRALLTRFIPERSGQRERLLDIIIRICKL